MSEVSNFSDKVSQARQATERIPKFITIISQMIEVNKTKVTEYPYYPIQGLKIPGLRKLESRWFRYTYQKTYWIRRVRLADIFQAQQLLVVCSTGYHYLPLFLVNFDYDSS